MFLGAGCLTAHISAFLLIHTSNILNQCLGSLLPLVWGQQLNAPSSVPEH